MANNLVELRIVATGSEQAAKVLQSVADAGAQVGKVTASGAAQAATGLQAVASGAKAGATGLATVTASGAVASSALSNVQQRAEHFNEAISAAGINTGIAGKVIAALTNPLVLTGIALGAVTAGALAGAHAMTENAREVKALMAVSGLGAEAADNLADTFQLLNIDSGILTAALFKMAQELDNGGAGLRKIGITYADVAKVTNEGELFLLVRDKISQMSSASERSAALMAVFGRSGRELAAAFALSREEMAKLTEKAGGISAWGADAQKTTETYIRSLNEMSLRFDALKQTVGARVLPVLTDYVALLNSIIGKGDISTTITLALKIAGAPDQTKSISGQIADLLLGEDLARGLDRLPGFRGRGASGGWEAPPGPDPRFAEQQAQNRVIAAQTASTKIMAAIAQEEEARKLAIGLRQTTEEDAAEQRLATVDRELAAKKAVFAAELRAAGEKDDLLGTKAAAVRQKIVQAESDAATKRLQLHADFVLKSIAAHQDLVASEIDGMKTAAVAEASALAERHRISQSLAVETAKAGTAEDAFMAQLDRETGALLEAATERIKNNQVLSDTIADLWRLHETKRVAFTKARESEEAKVQAAAIRTGAEAAMSATEAIEAAYTDRFNTLDQLRANDLLSEQDFARAVVRLGIETTEKRKTAYQQDFQNRVAQLSNSEARTRTFYQSLDNIRLAAQAKEIRDGQRFLAERLEWLETIAHAEQVNADLHFRTLSAQQQIEGRHFEFLRTQFQLIASQSATVWQGMADAVSSAAQSAHSAFSDFFNFMSDGFLDIEKLATGFLDILSRAVADFLAQQAVKLLFGLAGKAIDVLLGTASSATDNALHLAKGGVAGVGSLGGGSTDRILAMLSRGEMVLSSEVTSKLLSGDFSGLFETITAIKDQFLGGVQGVADTATGVANGTISVSDLMAGVGNWISANPGLAAGGAAAILGLALQFTGNEDAAMAGQLLSATAPLIGIGTQLAIGGISGATGVALGTSTAATLGATAGSASAGISAAAGGVAAAETGAVVGGIGAGAAVGGAVAWVMLPIIIGSIFGSMKSESELDPVAQGVIKSGALAPLATITQDFASANTLADYAAALGVATDAVVETLATAATMKAALIDKYDIDPLAARYFDPGNANALSDPTITVQAAAYQEALNLAAYEAQGITPPWLAKGGIVTRPTLAMIGEAGPEAVIPLPRLPRVFTPEPAAPADAGRGRSAAATNTTVNLHVHVLDPSQLTADARQRIARQFARDFQAEIAKLDGRRTDNGNAGRG